VIAAVWLLPFVSATAQPRVEPARVLFAPQPAYPPQAWSARVEGDVRFRAMLRADGMVESVEILAVPETNLGFEEAVRTAVAGWQFQPATLNGVATGSEYTGSLRFELRLPGEAIFAAPSRRTWDAALAMVRELGLRVQRADPQHQILIASGKYEPKKLLSAAELKLPANSIDGLIFLHVMVARDLEPARVAVGAVFDILSAKGRQLRMIRRYGNDDIVSLLLSRLAARMKVTMEPLSANVEQRAQQARALMPPNLTDPCSVVPAKLLTREELSRATRPLQRVSSVAATYPSDQSVLRREGTIFFTAELTEHGTIVNPQNTIHADDSGQFVLAAQMAARLWRFRPPVNDACPARTLINITQRFVLRK
jgi:TonB family protein